MSLAVNANAAAAATANRDHRLCGPQLLVHRELHRVTKANVAMVRRLGTKGKTPGGKVIKFAASIGQKERRPDCALGVHHIVPHLDPEYVPIVMGEQTFVDLSKRKIPPLARRNLLHFTEGDLEEFSIQKSELRKFLANPKEISGYIRNLLTDLKEQSEKNKASDLCKFLENPDPSSLPPYARTFLESHGKKIDASIASLEPVKRKLDDPDLTFLKLIENMGIFERCKTPLSEILKNVPAVACTALSPIDEASQDAPFGIDCKASSGSIVLQVALDDSANNGIGRKIFEHKDKPVPVRAYKGGDRDWKAQPCTEHDAKMVSAQQPNGDAEIVANAVSVLILQFSLGDRLMLSDSALQTVMTTGSVVPTNYNSRPLARAYRFESASFARIHVLACRSTAEPNSVIKTDDQILALADKITDFGTKQLQKQS